MHDSYSTFEYTQMKCIAQQADDSALPVQVDQYMSYKSGLDSWSVYVVPVR